MRIEAVTVCVDYDDFLQETAKHNRGLFDHWTIVTSTKDEKTREVCRKNNLRCLQSDDGERFGNPFSKGRLVERGLQHCSTDGWRLHLDADIVLPHDFRHRLEAADLQEDMIYGVDRVLCKSWDHWQTVKNSGYLQGEQYAYHCQTSFHKETEVGQRWAHPQFGYVPIGFFQLWHSSQDEWRGVRTKPYPLNHGTACRTDVQHGLQWDRHKRALLPELIVVHLESEIAKKGANWKGRMTKRFGPEERKLLTMSAGDSSSQGYHDGGHHHHHDRHHHHHGRNRPWMNIKPGDHK